ncbi:MAG TPA: hypothetical protein VMF13_10595 [Luteitalea sp.]|nr:hypothetical protein [Luteitalea sp.]
MTAASLWAWLVPGYFFTVAIEGPFLLVGLGARYRWRQRLIAALWLTAVTYPIVAVALPLLLWPRASYLAYFTVAEVFAIAVECLLFRWTYAGTPRDLVVVGLANVASASAGLAWFGLP